MALLHRTPGDSADSLSFRARLNDHQAMVRAIDLDRAVDIADQAAPMFREEWNHRVNALLKRAVRVDQSIEGRRVAPGALVTAERFAPGFASDLLELIAHLPRAVVQRAGQRGI